VVGCHGEDIWLFLIWWAAMGKVIGGLHIWWAATGKVIGELLIWWAATGKVIGGLLIWWASTGKVKRVISHLVGCRLEGNRVTSNSVGWHG
jgi:hypothetical protein